MVLQSNLSFEGWQLGMTPFGQNGLFFNFFNFKPFEVFVHQADEVPIFGESLFADLMDIKGNVYP